MTRNSDDGPEYGPCVCGHSFQDHDDNGACLDGDCYCSYYVEDEEAEGEEDVA